MSERNQILKDIITEMQMVNDDLTLPSSIWIGLAQAALRVIETPPDMKNQVIKDCTCGHTGYGYHKVGCELYGNH